MGKDFTNDQAELIAMRHVSLRDFAASLGWRIDTNDPNKMRLMGQTIVLGKAQKKHAPDGSDSFWLVGGDERQMGGIIEFVQFVAYPGFTLGDVRRKLRTWIGRAPSYSAVAVGAREFTDADQAGLDRLQNKLRESTVVETNEYLEARGISRETLAIARPLVSPRGTLWFPHRSPQEDRHICGLEMVLPNQKTNEPKIRFLGGGHHGAWGFGKASVKRVNASPTVIVCCECAIDAMSKAQLDEHPDERFYLSSGGSFGQNGDFAAIIKQTYDKGLTIVGAFDDDEPGYRLFATLLQICNGECESEFPQKKDWNDQLKWVLGITKGKEAA